MEPTQTKLLSASAELFAEHGFAGVSMRDIARATDITQAAIYHHFTNKEELYFAALEHLYEAQTVALVSEMERESSPGAQLTLLVSRLLEVFDENSQIRRIYFRELLEGDQQRLKLLSSRVFPEIDRFVRELMQELAPGMDSHLLVFDLAGLIFHHLEARKLSAQMDEGRPEHQQLPVLASHITKLLLYGVRGP